MSGTPRTDDQEYSSDGDIWVVPSEFARELELGLNNALEEIERLRAEMESYEIDKSKSGWM